MLRGGGWVLGGVSQVNAALSDIVRYRGDKLKGTNGAKFAVFRRFSLIPGNYSISEAQIVAENRRKPQIFAETGLSHVVCPF